MPDTIHTARYRRFRELLTEARKAQGLSQEALAAKLDRVQTFVSKYERGERRLDVLELIEIADALGIDPHAILKQMTRKK